MLFIIIDSPPPQATGKHMGPIVVIGLPGKT